jgi:hypothetical protein
MVVLWLMFAFLTVYRVLAVLKVLVLVVALRLGVIRCVSVVGFPMFLFLRIQFVVIVLSVNSFDLVGLAIVVVGIVLVCASWLYDVLRK